MTLAMVTAKDALLQGNGYVDLAQKSLEDKDAFEIAIVLSNDSCCTVDTLNLSGNRFSNAGINIMARALRRNNWLRGINLGGNSISHIGAARLSSVLKVNATLLILNLGGNNIGSEGAEMLAKALQTNPVLLKLYLCENNIGDDGAVALGYLLQSDSALERLWLGKNEISDAGTEAIAEGLKTNTKLQWLDLSDNRIRKAGAFSLAVMLRSNKTLQKLDLHHNATSECDLREVGLVPSNNTEVLRLNLASSIVHDLDARGSKSGSQASKLKSNKGAESDEDQSQSTESEGSWEEESQVTASTGISRLTSKLGDLRVMRHRTRANESRSDSADEEESQEDTQWEKRWFRSKRFLRSGVSSFHPYTIKYLDKWMASPHNDIPKTVRNARSIEQKLMKWLSRTAQREADRLDKYKASAADISLIIGIARLYHKTTPMKKVLAALRSEKSGSVFIAHSGLDKDKYVSLVDLYLRDNGVSTFYDPSMLPAEVDRDDLTMSAACTCKYMWCVLSKNFLKSPSALGELMIGYVRHLTEDRSSFCLILDCVETEYSRGGGRMNQILHEIETLKLYDANGKKRRFPNSIRAKSDENVYERVRRISSSELSGGRALVSEGDPSLSRASGLLEKALAQYQTVRNELDSPSILQSLDTLIAELTCVHASANRLRSSREHDIKDNNKEVASGLTSGLSVKSYRNQGKKFGNEHSAMPVEISVNDCSFGRKRGVRSRKGKNSPTTIPTHAWDSDNYSLAGLSCESSEAEQSTALHTVA